MKFFWILLILRTILGEIKLLEKIKRAEGSTNMDVIMTQHNLRLIKALQMRSEMVPEERELIQDQILKLEKTHVFQQHNLPYQLKIFNDGTYKIGYHKPGEKKQIHLRQYVKLSPRFQTRKIDEASMQCSLEVKVFPMERFTDLNYLRLKVEFRSNCFVGNAIKYYEIKRQKYMPSFLKISIQGEEFIFEYSKRSKKYLGKGTERKELYDVVRLQQIYVARIAVKPEIEKNFPYKYVKAKAIKEQIPIQMERKLSKYRGYSIQSEDQFPNIFYEKEQYKRMYSTYVRYRHQLLHSPVPKIKKPFDTQFRHLKFYAAGTKFDILSPQDKQTGYFPYDALSQIWGTSGLSKAKIGGYQPIKEWATFTEWSHGAKRRKRVYRAVRIVECVY